MARVPSRRDSMCRSRAALAFSRPFDWAASTRGCQRAPNSSKASERSLAALCSTATVRLLFGPAAFDSPRQTFSLPFGRWQKIPFLQVRPPSNGGGGGGNLGGVRGRQTEQNRTEQNRTAEKRSEVNRREERREFGRKFGLICAGPPFANVIGFRALACSPGL